MELFATRRWIFADLFLGHRLRLMEALYLVDCVVIEQITT